MISRTPFFSFSEGFLKVSKKFFLFEFIILDDLRVCVVAEIRFPGDEGGVVVRDLVESDGVDLRGGVYFGFGSYQLHCDELVQFGKLQNLVGPLRTVFEGQSHGCVHFAHFVRVALPF